MIDENECFLSCLSLRIGYKMKREMETEKEIKCHKERVVTSDLIKSLLKVKCPVIMSI